MDVMIGVDPHKGSHTAVAIGSAEESAAMLSAHQSAICLVMSSVGEPSKVISSFGCPRAGRQPCVVGLNAGDQLGGLASQRHLACPGEDRPRLWRVG